MKITIRRLPPHQNALSLAVLMTIFSVVVMLPLTFFLANLAPEGGPGLMAAGTVSLIAVPIFYFVITYISTFLICWVYNLLIPFIGGLVFETDQ